MTKTDDDDSTVAGHYLSWEQENGVAMEMELEEI